MKKKILLIILCGVCLLGITGCGIDRKNKEVDKKETDSEVQYDSVEDESEAIKDTERTDLEEIDVDKYLELKSSTKASVIYIMRTGCSWCELEDPIMEHVQYQYKSAPIYKLNIADFENDDSSKFTESDEMFSSNNWGTPTTIIVKDGEIVDKIVGASLSKEIIKVFKNNEIIK